LAVALAMTPIVLGVYVSRDDFDMNTPSGHGTASGAGSIYDYEYREGADEGWTYAYAEFSSGDYAKAYMYGRIPYSGQVEQLWSGNCYHEFEYTVDAEIGKYGSAVAKFEVHVIIYYWLQMPGGGPWYPVQDAHIQKTYTQTGSWYVADELQTIRSGDTGKRWSSTCYQISHAQITGGGTPYAEVDVWMDYDVYYWGSEYP
jgi:hypothetical protein